MKGDHMTYEELMTELNEAADAEATASWYNR